MNNLKNQLQKNWLIIGVGVIIAALLWPLVKATFGIGSYVSEFFTEKDGPVKIDQELARIKQQPTKSESYWRTIADAIYTELGTFSMFEKGERVVSYCTLVQNDADFLLLVKAFGVREEKSFGIGFGGGKNLHTFINEDLKNSEKQTINENYESKNIQYRF